MRGVAPAADATLHYREVQRDIASARDSLHGKQEEMGATLSGDHKVLYDRLSVVEERLQQDVKEIRGEAKDDMRLVFAHLLEIRDTIGKSALKLGSILSGLIILGLGALFAWLWMEVGSQRNLASQQRNEVLANTRLIAELVTQEKIQDQRVRDKARETLLKHLISDHGVPSEIVEQKTEKELLLRKEDEGVQP